MGWYVQLHWKPGLPIETKTKHRHWGIDAQCKSFGSYVWLLIAAVKSLLLSETASIWGDLNVASPPNDSSNGWRDRLGKWSRKNEISYTLRRPHMGGVLSTIVWGVPPKVGRYCSYLRPISQRFFATLHTVRFYCVGRCTQ